MLKKILVLSLLLPTVMQALDPKIGALGSICAAAIAMTGAKKLENHPMVQKFSFKTGLDPVDVAGAVGVSAGCITLGCLTDNKNVKSQFFRYAFRAPIAALVGFGVTSNIFNDMVVNAPFIGEFLARKQKNYVLLNENGEKLDINCYRLMNENGDMEAITGTNYTSNYRLRGTIVSAAVYVAIDAGINALVEKYPSLKCLNGQFS